MEMPPPPQISEENLHKCRETGDCCPVMFDWYKYVSQIAKFYASLPFDPAVMKDIPKTHYTALIGLLNRCSRLMFSNIALSHEGLFGETTSIIDHAIFESAITVSWLCHKPDEDSFSRFIADGLKSEVKFKNEVETNIAQDDGTQVAVEERMINSIGNYIENSGLTEDEIINLDKIPDITQMIEVIGKDKLAYIVGEKIGLHHVKGTWVSIVQHYIKENDGIAYPREHNIPTYLNQYMYIALVVLDAVSAFISYFCKNEEDARSMLNFIEAIDETIHEIFKKVVSSNH